MGAWRDWYHCMCSTYGAWLRGDPRGWRSRHHRERVEGDYRRPPPSGKYASLYRRSAFFMKRNRARIPPELRELVLSAIVASLKRRGIQIVIASLDDRHLHILARFSDHNPRHWIGPAKKDSARLLSDRRLGSPGGVRAKRSKALPIRDRNHQLSLMRYIIRHAHRGSALRRGFKYATPTGISPPCRPYCSSLR